MRQSIRRRFLGASCCAAALAFTPLSAQEPGRKVDPLLRPLLDPEVSGRVAAAPALERAGAALRLPLQDVIVLRRAPGRPETFVDVFVSLTERAPEVVAALGGQVTARAGALVAARVPVTALSALAADPRVRYVQAARRIQVRNDLAMQDIRASALRSRSGADWQGATGRGVLVGIYDTGIDWSHEDFKHPDGTTSPTRIRYIWDQTDTLGTPPGDVGGQVFDFGNECDAAEIDGGTCSQRDVGAHGTHVAGSAAGDGSHAGALGFRTYQYAGVAPAADIIAVKGGDFGFSTADVVAGIQYIFRRAEVLGRPAVVNFSFGGAFGPHDGTEPMEQAVDSLSGPGRIVVIAAGNDGRNPTATTGNNPTTRIHGTRTLGAGQTAELLVTVPPYTPTANSFNDLMLFSLWYDGRDTLTITLTRPNGTSVTRRTGQPALDRADVNGHVFVDNAAVGVAPQNGDHEAAIWAFDLDPTQPPASGTWRLTVRLDHLGGSGRFDVWLYAATIDASFSAGGDNAYVVGTPGNAARAITVGAHVTRVNWTSVAGQFQFAVREAVGDLATFSSSGPTRPVRDSLPERQKPDITAPGKGIFSAYSSHSNPAAPSALITPDGVHVLSAGTSMAAPIVTGAVALLLERNGGLTPEQVRAILTAGARQDAFTPRSFTGFGGGVPNPSWGWGKVDAESALARVPVTRTVTEGPANDSIGGRFVVPRADLASIQLRLRGDSADHLRLTRLVLRSTSSLGTPLAVDGVRLYRDVDSTGTIGPGDVLLATRTIPANSGDVDFSGLDVTISASSTAYLVGAYALNDGPPHAATFRLDLASAGDLAAERTADGTPAPFSGTPVVGAVVRVQEVGRLAVTGRPLRHRTAGMAQPDVVLLRLDAAADFREGGSLRRLVGRFGGTAPVLASLANIRLVPDRDADGHVDQDTAGTVRLAQTLGDDTLRAHITPPGEPRVAESASTAWLLIADLVAGAVESATVSFTLDTLAGRGLVTDSVILAAGTPVAGDTIVVVRTSIALDGVPEGAVEVLRDARAVPLLRVRFIVDGEPLRVDSLIFRAGGTLSGANFGVLKLVVDADSNGLLGPLDTPVPGSLAFGAGGEIRAVGAGVRLEPGSTWWLLTADGAGNATWGETIQVRLDSADVHARGEASGLAPVRRGPAGVAGAVLSVGGVAALSAGSNFADSIPVGRRVHIGANALLPFVISATTLEGARIDTLILGAGSGIDLATLVTQLRLYVNPPADDPLPPGAPTATLTNPFADGPNIAFAGVAAIVPAGGATTFLIVADVTDRLRQGDTLGLRLDVVRATGVLSGRPADLGTGLASFMGRATLLNGTASFLISENPVTSGRVIFSYDAVPRRIAVYSVVGLKVREFRSLPAARFEWDIRGEAPGLPNGVYVLVLETASERLRRRLMILSPAR